MSLTFKAEKHYRDGRVIVFGLYDGEHRIGCAWETTVVDGLFNWTLFAIAAPGQGYGWHADGYSMDRACHDLMEAARGSLMREAA